MLHLRLTQNRQHVKCGQRTTIFALLEVSPDESTQIIQRRHHVALVIDRSGSMDGKKMQDAKDAAISVVRGLSPDDLVSIVTFETEVEVVLSPTPASDSSIEGIIRSIKTAGGTALHGGIATAFQLLQQAMVPNMVSRIELFTDGEPNIMPYDDQDFELLVTKIKDAGVTIDAFGIGDDYNESLLMQIAETGRGKWQHVSDSNELTRMVGDQMTVMLNTVIVNPELQLTLMPNAELATVAITKPVLQDVSPESRRVSGNTTYIKLSDIIKDESQTVAMRIAIPPVEGGNDVSVLTASIIEAGKEVASQTAAVSCTTDKQLYNMEVDPSPRVILSSSEATVMLRRGLEGDQEATRMAKTILKGLEDPETTRLMNDDAHATVINARKISGDVRSGMSESEKKRLMHESTVIGLQRGTEAARPACPHCGATVRPTSKVCGHCGKNISGVGGA